MTLVPLESDGFVLAVSAPSGTGKTSLCDRLAKDHTFCVRSVSVTTRPQRAGETSGKDYSFVSESDFQRLEKSGSLLESASVFGNWYGTPRVPVEQAIKAGQIIVMDIDTQGALRVKELLKEKCVTVFIVPPSLEELETRLRKRGKDTPEVLEKRLKEATREMKMATRYEYVMANVGLEEAYRQLESIVFAERAKCFRLHLNY